MSTTPLDPPAPAGARATSRHLLITGAAGSVGALLVEEALARGYQVRATDRPGAPAPAPREGLQWVAADLTRAEALPALVEGIEAVVHAAAWVDIHVPFETQAPINLDAVRSLYGAAQAAGCRSFLFVSTGSLYAPSAVPLTEDSPVKAGSGYEQAKLLAEDYLRSRPEAGPTVNLLRPALIYGPRGRVLVNALGTIPVLLAPLRGGIVGLAGGPRTNLGHACAVARGARFLEEQPASHGRVFNVAADEAAPFGDYAQIVLELGGMRPLPWRVPFPTALLQAGAPLINQPALSAGLNRVLAGAWKLTARWHRLVPDGVAPRLDLEALPYMIRDTIFDNSRLKSLGFQYTYPDFRAGWENTLSWYRAQRWLS